MLPHSMRSKPLLLPRVYLKPRPLVRESKTFLPPSLNTKQQQDRQSNMHTHQHTSNQHTSFFFGAGTGTPAAAAVAADNTWATRWLWAAVVSSGECRASRLATQQITKCQNLLGGGGIDSKYVLLAKLMSMGDIREGVVTVAVAVELLAATGGGILRWGGLSGKYL